MTTIELINKLSELGRLVEIWKEPTDEALECFGWKCTETTSCHTPLYIKVNHQTLTSKEIVLNDFEKAWNHEITQASFKAEVRKVAGKIARDFDFLKHFYKIDTYDSCYLDLSFDDLFKTLLESASKQEKFFCLSAICHKMGVELERKGA